MKEYLTKNSSGSYQLVNHRFLESDIEVPMGAEIYVQQKNTSHAFFAKNNGETIDTFNTMKKSDWHKESTLKMDNVNTHYLIVWQRENPVLIEEKISDVDSILAERQSQYGYFEDVAKTSQDILKALRIGNYDSLPDPHKEALHMMASKMARIVHGDGNHIDSWVDIGGYSKLIVNLIEGK